MLKMLRNWMNKRSFDSELKRRLINDSWLRQTYLCANLYLTSNDSAKDNLASQAIQTQMTDEFLQMISRVVGLHLLEVSQADNKVLACRLWIVQTIGEYSALRALYTPASTYGSEVAEGMRHESTKGLYESFDVFAPKVYSQYFPSKSYQGTEENNEELRCLSLAYQFWLDIGNYGRIGLGDEGPWFRNYFDLCVALAEANLKSGTEASYIAAVLSDEREVMRRVLLEVAA